MKQNSSTLGAQISSYFLQVSKENIRRSISIKNNTNNLLSTERVQAHYNSQKNLKVLFLSGIANG